MNLRKFEFIKLRRALPSATDEMIEDFLDENGVSPVTARIWAEQGVISVVDGKIAKATSPSISPAQVVAQLEKVLIL